MEFEKLTLTELVKLVQERKVTSESLVSYFLDRCEKFKKYNAVLETFEDSIARAKEMDKKIVQGFVGKLAGIPVIIKDNILFEGKKCSCSSKFLEEYVAQYSSTVVQKLIDSGAIIIGRANMDEFAMGGSTENSAYGVTHNAHNFERVAGGSSGGSATAVALGLAPLALGTDTGGSIRQPSAYNGIVGLKPTYGRVSRFGVVAFSSSIEQVGPMTKTVEDNAYVLEVLAGKSDHDETSVDAKVDFLEGVEKRVDGLKVGLVQEVEEMLSGAESQKAYLCAIEILKKQGVEFVKISIPSFSLALPCYYIIAPAEAASNLGRFDGIKYSKRSEDAKNINEIYNKSRSQGFGKEVKRRIMLGNFVLSSGFFDAYYGKAKAVQQKLINEIEKVFSCCDVVLLPTTSGSAFKIGEKSDPVSMYKEDYFTIPANIMGLPAISVPCEKGADNMPLAVQIMGKAFDEKTVYCVARAIERR
jgi:aspartyl-tRNA(Asn)/glutamyl-tRNA(Gln) amidotransferase subunit A